MNPKVTDHPDFEVVGMTFSVHVVKNCCLSQTFNRPRQPDSIKRSNVLEELLFDKYSILEQRTDQHLLVLTATKGIWTVRVCYNM